MNAENAEPTLRLDIWLWRARFIKTRSQASRFVSSGKVRLTRNGQQSRITKPHFKLTAGDHLLFVRANALRNIEVLGLGQRRGPAPEARALYRDVNPEPTSSENVSADNAV